MRTIIGTCVGICVRCAFTCPTTSCRSCGQQCSLRASSPGLTEVNPLYYTKYSIIGEEALNEHCWPQDLHEVVGHVKAHRTHIPTHVPMMVLMSTVEIIEREGNSVLRSKC